MFWMYLIGMIPMHALIQEYEKHSGMEYDLFTTMIILIFWPVICVLALVRAIFS